MITKTPEILFIAEVSANHLGSLERAHKLIDAAADSGATAVKFQTYTPDTMTLNLKEFAVSQDHDLWGGRSLYELYQEAMTPWDWHPELFEHCRKRRVIPFSSPFDASAVDFLEKLDAPMYKIASLETSDHELIRKVGATGKPVIISTGASHFEEIIDLVQVFHSTGNRDLTLLVCTSSYPAQPKDANLRRMENLRDTFNVKVGLSDHTLGIGVSVAAIALGATAIEKHITLKRSDGGADAAFSMEPEEFAYLVSEGNSASLSLGNYEWSIQESEEESRRLRRSLYVVRNVTKGEVITEENIRSIRPGGGMSSKYFSELLGKKFNRNLSIGTPMSSEYLSEPLDQDKND
jgi:N-acetylneuraminate synthase